MTAHLRKPCELDHTHDWCQRNMAPGDARLLGLVAFCLIATVLGVVLLTAEAWLP